MAVKYIQLSSVYFVWFWPLPTNYKLFSLKVISQISPSETGTLKRTFAQSRARALQLPVRDFDQYPRSALKWPSFRSFHLHICNWHVTVYFHQAFSPSSTATIYSHLTLATAHRSVKKNVIYENNSFPFLATAGFKKAFIMSMQLIVSTLCIKSDNSQLHCAF